MAENLLALQVQPAAPLGPVLGQFAQIQNTQSEIAARNLSMDATRLSMQGQGLENTQKALSLAAMKGVQDGIASGLSPEEAAKAYAGIAPQTYAQLTSARATMDANSRAQQDYKLDQVGRAIDGYDALSKTTNPNTGKTYSPVEAGNITLDNELQSGLITKEMHDAAYGNAEAQIKLFQVGRAMAIAAKEWNAPQPWTADGGVTTTGQNMLAQPGVLGVPPQDGKQGPLAPPPNALAAAAGGTGASGVPAGATPVTAAPPQNLLGASTGPSVGGGGQPGGPALAPAVAPPGVAPAPQNALAPPVAPAPVAAPAAPSAPGQTQLPPELQAKYDERAKTLANYGLDPKFVQQQLDQYRSDLLNGPPKVGPFPGASAPAVPATQPAGPAVKPVPVAAPAAVAPVIAPAAAVAPPVAPVKGLPSTTDIAAEGSAAGVAAKGTGTTPQIGGPGQLAVSAQERARQAALGKQVSDMQGAVAEEATNAQNGKRGLTALKSSLETVAKSGGSFLTPGPGEGDRIGIAKGLNTLLVSAGAAPLFDPNAIAAAESATKESTRLGFDLARSLGSREAMQIVQQAVSVVPNLEQTPLGARRLVASIDLAWQRSIDQSAFVQAYADKNPDGGLNAVGAFNQAHPPEEYAMRAIVQSMPEGNPGAAIDTLLKLGPTSVQAFDLHFGQGVGEWALAHPDLAKAAVRSQY